eukprot:Skav231967  [mRNA]  locus=scaffold2806:298945:301188:+ [translate_table: standard]
MAQMARAGYPRHLANAEELAPLTWQGNHDHRPPILIDLPEEDGRGVRIARVLGTDCQDCSVDIPERATTKEVPKILFAIFALMVTMALIFHATPTVAASLGGLISANAAVDDGVVIYAYQQPGCSGPETKISTSGKPCEAVRRLAPVRSMEISAVLQ